MRQQIKVNGVEISVLLQRLSATVRTHEAQTLVLLHGFTGSAVAWGDLLTELALPGMRVIALDLLGHGQSTAPEDPQRYSIEHCQDDIIATLLALGVQKGEAILLGYSMGGRIALYTALSGFFRALILESASAGLADSIEREQRCASDMKLAESIEQAGIPAFVEQWEKLPLFASQHNLPVERKVALHQQRLNNTAQGLANSLRGVGTGVQPALQARLPDLTLPVLLIAGALDSKFCQIAWQMAERLPQAKVQIVPDAGHTVHLEQPLVFREAVRDFCTTVLS